MYGLCMVRQEQGEKVLAFSCVLSKPPVFIFHKVLVAAAVLLYPGLILIDHGHFQYPLDFSLEP